MLIEVEQQDNWNRQVKPLTLQRRQSVDYIYRSTQKPLF